MGVLLAWGPYRFETGGTSFEELEHKVAQRRRRHEIIGRAPAGQYLGPDVEPVRLRGSVYPRYDGDDTARQLREMQASCQAGESYILLSGEGDIYGLFTLERMSRRESHHLTTGSAQKVTFEAEFTADVDPAGTVWSLWP